MADNNENLQDRATDDEITLASLNALITGLRTDVDALKATPATPTDGAAPTVDLSSVNAAIEKLNTAVFSTKVDASAETPAA